MSAAPPRRGLLGGRLGRYHLLDRLGVGGMGTVHRAWDPALRRTVALKKVHAEDFAPEGRRRFLEEAAVTANLDHPGIVPVYDLGEGEDGVPFFTMKQVRGHTLHDVIVAFHGRRKGEHESWTLFRLVDVVRRVSETLAFAHDRGVLHRDLKPSNIMVGPYGEVLVMDWGLAGALPDQRDGVQLGGAGATRAGQAMGTPGYMSPEQARGTWDRVDARSDVWGLGAILYEVLTGRPPHGPEDGAVERAKSGLVEPVRSLSSGAPRELAAVAERALMADPERRYPSATALAADLAAWQEGGEVSAYRYTALDRTRRLIARHGRTALIGLGLLAALAALLTAGLGLVRQQRDRAIVAEGQVRQGLVTSLLDRASRSLVDGKDTDAALLAGAAMDLDPTRLDARGLFLGASGGWSPELLAEVDTDNASCLHLAFSADGDRLACVSLADQLYLWSVAEGGMRPVGRFTALPGALAFSSDGALLASADLDNSVILRDGDSGVELGRLRGHKAQVWALQILDQDRQLVSGDKSGRVLVWDLRTGTLIREIASALLVVTAMTAPADGRVLYVDGLPHLVALDTATWRIIGEFPLLSTHRSLAVSPTGDMLAAAGLANGGGTRPEVWDLARGVSFTVPDSGESEAGDVLFQGRDLLWSTHDGIVCRQRLGGTTTSSFRAHPMALAGLAASTDGRLLATAGEQRVRLWAASSPSPSEIAEGMPSAIWQVAYVDGGARLLVGGTDGRLREVELASGRVREVSDLAGEQVTGLIPVDDGRLVYASTFNPGRVLAWDRARGGQRVVVEGGRSVRQIAVDPSGRRVAFGPEEPGFTVLDAASGVRLWEGRTYVDHAVLSPDGAQMLLVYRDNEQTRQEISVVAASTGLESARLDRGAAAPVVDAAWSPDGARTVLIDMSGNVEIWGMQGASRLNAWLGRGRGRARVAWSHDGRLIATAQEAQLSLWSAQDGQPLAHLSGLVGTPHAIAFSPDDRALVTAGAGQPLRILNLSDLETPHEALVSRVERRWGLAVVAGKIVSTPPPTR